MSKDVSILWLRRDLRLSDHPALCAAAEAGAVVPVFIRSAWVDDLGSAARWRLGLSLDALAGELEDRGSRLILRAGPPREVLEALIEETGATSVHWTRLYDGESQERDAEIKSALKDQDIAVESHPGHVLFEPWTVETGSGSYYKVYTPYRKAVEDRDIPEPLDIPDLAAPGKWPESDSLSDWNLSADMNRGAEVVAGHVSAGPRAAVGRMGAFMRNGIVDYDDERDRPDHDGTSKLSEYFAWGELGIRQAWHASKPHTGQGAQTFRQELIWRDFAWHLIYHTPQIEERNWREKWDDFPWRDDNEDAERWRRGMTGEPIVDAGMRQLYVTGWMHNRVRMIVASYLTKHLMTHWKVGLDWFAECLVDHDPASNAMGWQWSAGSGPDATPFFRVFNPATQAEKFDPDGSYRDNWLRPETYKDAASFFQAIPRSWGMSADDPYPDPLVDLKEGRERALDAYGEFKD
ncbi:deoxyribodipyrimidine photo-lyase [Roseobacter sp. HKCCA0434]|uniref:cryptochrome/photolyase family protein n=1 Tax=Roseobacter sp. HKCCA0434 TaxID=3079297 RepID=UPI002905A4B3|nr:deoxyribodipyrimidine photo-lyase [Roseobacter sp. HKCCA0434]